jgi:hypothetical protein
LDNDHDEEGIVVIANLYGGGDIHDPRAREEFRDIKMSVLLHRQEGERTYREMFKRYGRRVFIAMSAQALAQLNGINVISYYAPYLFERAGWHGRDAILMAGINGLTYVASTIPPWYIVDRWGRRPILLTGAIAMMVSLSLISYVNFLAIPATPNLVVILVVIYNAAFGYSWGPIPWLYPPEILPLKIRSKGASLSTATNWAFNWLVGQMTPLLQEWISWRLYLVHAFWCGVSFIVGTLPPPPTAPNLFPNILTDLPLQQCISSTPKPAASASKTWTSSSATRPAPSAPRRPTPPRPCAPSRTRCSGPSRPCRRLTAAPRAAPRWAATRRVPPSRAWISIRLLMSRRMGSRGVVAARVAVVGWLGGGSRG